MIKRRLNRIKNITGMRFGRLVVIKFTGYTHISNTCPSGKPKYLCQCDCGNFKEIASNNLLKKKLSTQSCGCIQKERSRQKNLLPPGKASFNSLFLGYMSQAKIRGHDFCLSKEKFEELTSGNCFYCGAMPSKKVRRYRKGKITNGDYIYNGIDRMINSIGYIEENCVSCCWRCNKLKKSYSYEDFVLAIKEIYEHYFEKNKNTVFTP